MDASGDEPKSSSLSGECLFYGTPIFEMETRN